MNKDLRDILEAWPYQVIRDNELASLLNKAGDSFYSYTKRAIKAKKLIRLRKGLYLITQKTKVYPPDEFAIALFIYAPSFISLESALAYHGWIPEAVYTITSVSPKRAQVFKTHMGDFSYKRVPEKNFYLGVERVSKETGTFFIAEPWRALADLIYVKHINWKTLEDIASDLRIDIDTMKSSNLSLLKELSTQYPSMRVRNTLNVFFSKINK